jgi:hypothetical protein
MKSHLIRCIIEPVIPAEAKILVIVGHALYEPWKTILYEGQLETWAKSPSLNVRHVYATPVNRTVRKIDAFIWKLKWESRFGKLLAGVDALSKSPFRIFQGNLLEVHLPDTTHPALHLKMPDLDFLMNFKSFAVITGTLKYDYDFLVVTTTSSYLNLNKLNESIQSLPKANVVAGRILMQSDIKFASGSFRVFSRDVVDYFLANKKSYSKWRPEDLAYGYLKSLNEPPFNFIDIESLDINSIETLEKKSDSELMQTVHFRLKSGTYNERNDVSIMKNLHERIAKLC